MAVWVVPLVSSLDVVTSSKSIIQQKIPCSTHKYLWVLCILKYLKVSKTELTGKGEKQRRVPRTQPGAQSRSQERGEIRFHPALSEALRSRKVERTSLPEWSAHTVAEPNGRGSDWAQRWSHSYLAVSVARQKNKAMEPGHLPSPSQRYQWAPEKAVVVSMRGYRACYLQPW